MSLLTIGKWYRIKKELIALGGYLISCNWRECSLLSMCIEFSSIFDQSKSINILNLRRPLDALSNYRTLPPVVHSPPTPPKIFGCVVFVHLHPHQRSKLESRAIKCTVIGYGGHQKSTKVMILPLRNSMFLWMLSSIKTNFFTHQQQIHHLKG